MKDRNQFYENSRILEIKNMEYNIYIERWEQIIFTIFIKYENIIELNLSNISISELPNGVDKYKRLRILKLDSN